MSRSYAILAAALVGIAGLAGIARGSSGDDESAAGPEVLVEAPAADRTEPSTEVSDEPEPVPPAAIEPHCTLTVRLELGDEHAEVACLESELIAAGVLVGATPDSTFDAATDAAVRAFQAQNGLVVDGVVGPRTAMQIAARVGADGSPPDPATCPSSGRSAVVDRVAQRSWLCEAGSITEVMPMTSAASQPDLGRYQVYAKDLNASSMLSGKYSTMTHFVAFTYGKYQGARIAFHSIPKDADGEYVQPLESVGTVELLGDSSGCIRLLPEDAEQMWNWLDIGDTVTVVS